MQGVRQQEGERIHENSTPDRNDRDGPDCGYRDRGDDIEHFHGPGRHTVPAGGRTSFKAQGPDRHGDSNGDSITGYVILRRIRMNNTGGDFGVLVADTGSATTTYTYDTVAASLPPLHLPDKGDQRARC